MKRGHGFSNPPQPTGFVFSRVDAAASFAKTHLESVAFCLPRFVVPGPKEFPAWRIRAMPGKLSALRRIDRVKECTVHPESLGGSVRAFLFWRFRTPRRDRLRSYDGQRNLRQAVRAALKTFGARKLVVRTDVPNWRITRVTGIDGKRSSETATWPTFEMTPTRDWARGKVSCIGNAFAPGADYPSRSIGT